MIVDAYLKEIPGRLEHFENIIGLNKTKIAEKAGMSRSSYSNIATGAQTPSFDFLYRMCLTFGLSADWLIFGEGQMFRADNEFLSSIDQVWIDTLKEIHLFPINLKMALLQQVIQALKTIEEAQKKELN